MFSHWQYRTRLAFLGRCCALWSLSFAATLSAAESPPSDDSAWSAESNGLQARLVMRRLSVFNGTARIATYLEVKNVRPLLNPLMLKEPPLTFTVTDSDGREIPMKGGSFSGPAIETPPLVLPYDSLVRFRIGPTGWGVEADQAAALDLGPRYGWHFPRDGKAYYLEGALDLPPQKDDRSGSAIVWHGKLHLPRVRIPTEPDPVDPKTIVSRIAELGPKLLSSNSEVSESAAAELSLIDDPRVIPWYIKAVKSDSYSLRFSALDRLSRMEGDEALAGLKIGMATAGPDIGNCATEKVASDLAVNIRVLAAQSLARSPHSQAKSLLWTMEKDPSKSVRLTVVQTAAGVATPEALAILQRGAQDTDEMVRNEAIRLMNDQRK